MWKISLILSINLLHRKCSKYFFRFVLFLLILQTVLCHLRLFLSFTWCYKYWCKCLVLSDACGQNKLKMNVHVKQVRACKIRTVCSFRKLLAEYFQWKCLQLSALIYAWTILYCLIPFFIYKKNNICKCSAALKLNLLISVLFDSALKDRGSLSTL